RPRGRVPSTRRRGGTRRRATVALAPDASFDARTPPMELVARLDRLRAARERLSPWRAENENVAGRRPLCRTPPACAPPVLAPCHSDVGARDWRYRRCLRHRASRDLRSSAVRERERGRDVLDAGMVDGRGIPLSAWEDPRLPAGRRPTTGRRDDARRRPTRAPS